MQKLSGQQCYHATMVFLTLSGCLLLLASSSSFHIQFHSSFYRYLCCFFPRIPLPQFRWHLSSHLDVLMPLPFSPSFAFSPVYPHLLHCSPFAQLVQQHCMVEVKDPFIAIDFYCSFQLLVQLRLQLKSLVLFPVQVVEDH